MDNKKMIHIVIIDSGYNTLNCKEDVEITGLGIEVEKDGSLKVSMDYEDQIGHGTAVVDALLKTTESVDRITCIRIIRKDIDIEATCLLAALKYVLEEIVCDLVLISAGVICTDLYKELLSVIEALTNRGTLIVSAYDNDGSMSFPAAFDSVIGVGTTDVTNKMASVSVEGPVNVILPDRFYRLRWVSPARVIIRGSSFAAAEVAAICANILLNFRERNKKIDKEELLEKLSLLLKCPMEKSNSSYLPSWDLGKKFVKKIHKAIVFPWNKETHAFAQFQELLQFEVSGYYDLRYCGHVGKKVSDLIGISAERGCIMNYEKMDWNNEFDTVILGHCQELSKLTRKNWLRDIVECCEKYGKRLYAFDQECVDIAGREVECFTPGINVSDIPKQNGKMFSRLTPVVGVFGTSSQQGKFTLQLELRRRFLMDGYRVGQIGSEPSGYLFGFNGVIPFGYNSNVKTNTEELLMIINRMIWDASDFDSCDVIIVGGQSGSVPYSHQNSHQYNFQGYNFLCGTNPDVFVLCVNPHDPIEYIQRTIWYLRSFNDSPVVALVLFPIIYEPIVQFGYGFKRRKITDEEKYNTINKLINATGLPVFCLGVATDMDHAYEQILNALSEE